MPTKQMSSLGRVGTAVLLFLAAAVILGCSGVMESLVREGSRLQYQDTQRAGEQGTFRAQYRQTFAATFDVLGTQEAAIQGTQTALVAEIDAAEAAEAAPPAPQIDAPPAAAPPGDQPPAPAPAAPPAAPVSSAPVITRVDFPSGIPANGTKITGWVSFKDTDGDVNWMTLEVVESKTMKGSEGDPRVHMQGSPTDGRCWMQFWCYVKQEITMRVTLFDAAGNRSNSMDFEFECQ